MWRNEKRKSRQNLTVIATREWLDSTDRCVSLCESDVKIEKQLKKTEKKSQNNLRKKKSSDKRKKFRKCEKNWKISIKF